MTITENDFIEKMIEIAKTGYENMTQLQCVFFTWNEYGRRCLQSFRGRFSDFLCCLSR